MPIAETALWLFAPKQEDQGQQPGSQEPAEKTGKKRARPLFKQLSREEEGGRNKKGRVPVAARSSARAWPAPKPADKVQDEMTKTANKGQCCSLQCTLKFSSKENDPGGSGPMHNGEFLKLEQERFQKFKREQDRKQFVVSCVPPAKLNKGSMMAANTPVCNRAFRGFFGVSESLISSCKGTPKARASSSVTRTAIQRTRDRPKLERAVSFLRRYQDIFGQSMPNSDEQFLYLKYRNELYDEYEIAQRKVFAGDLVGLAGVLCTRDYFNKVWAEHFPHLKLKPHGDFMLCQICTLLKSSIHGRPGARSLQDEAQAAIHKQEYDDHIEDVFRDRLYGAQLTDDAENARMNGKPEEKTYMMVDAANQSNFAMPLSADNAHGLDDKGYAERTKVYGVFVSGEVMNVFFAPQILGVGSNLVCTALYTQFMELTLKWGRPLGDVFIQVDNTVSENKNNHLLGFLAAMVARGAVRTVTLCFMLVGHTHIQIDQVFSCFARAVKGSNIFTREELGDVFMDAYQTLEVRCRTLESLANFKDLVSPVTRRLPNITKYQAFRVYKEGTEIMVKVKDKMHHEDWLGFSADGKTAGLGAGFDGWRLMRESSVCLEETPPYQLKTVDPYVRKQIEVRQRASRLRLPYSFPSDEEKHKKIEDQQNDSLRILEETGLRMFDLDTDWLPAANNGVREDEEDESTTESEDCPGDGRDTADFNEGDEDDSSDEESIPLWDQQQQGARVPKEKRKKSGLQEVEHGAIGSFGFLVPSAAPFLMGKSIAVRENARGETEVLFHWYTPRKQLVDIAATVPFDTYAGATFTPTYKQVERNITGTRRAGSRRTLEPDTAWEPVCGIVATCTALLKGGKKIPASVKEIVKAEKTRQVQEVEEDDEPREAQGSVGGGSGAGADGAEKEDGGFDDIPTRGGEKRKVSSPFQEEEEEDEVEVENKDEEGEEDEEPREAQGLVDGGSGGGADGAEKEDDGLGDVPTRGGEKRKVSSPFQKEGEEEEEDARQKEQGEGGGGAAGRVGQERREHELEPRGRLVQRLGRGETEAGTRTSGRRRQPRRQWQDC